MNRSLEDRVTSAAEAILENQRHVSAVEMLILIGLLPGTSADAWRRGRIPYLEDAIQAGRDKVSSALRIFAEWAKTRGLQPLETAYVRSTREGAEPLRFTNIRYVGLEEAFRANFASPQLSGRRRQTVEKKASAAPERVVFIVRRDSECGECGADLSSGSFLTMDANEPLCLACAGLGELEFLPRGDVALTRRATKYSPNRAVVVEWSRSRKRYERQGILVTEEAIQKAEEECAEDAPERALQRERAAVTRKKEDAEFVEEMTAAIRAMFPACPPAEVGAIAAHTALRGSGRVGRSAAGRRLDSNALRLAVIAAIRHRHTDYDVLLIGGVERADARARVQEKIDVVLESWGWAI